MILSVRLTDEGARLLFVVMAAAWQRLAERSDYEEVRLVSAGAGDLATRKELTPSPCDLFPRT